mmetsp:Transcript_45965/g.141578  ORF Transcript_45965/g.141578 Transcript_45965/m.141578 type:complete len:429 (+) Transcript_45965:376-1662(+)
MPLLVLLLLRLRLFPLELLALGGGLLGRLVRQEVDGEGLVEVPDELHDLAREVVDAARHPELDGDGAVAHLGDEAGEVALEARERPRLADGAAQQAVPDLVDGLRREVARGEEAHRPRAAALVAGVLPLGLDPVAEEVVRGARVPVRQRRHVVDRAPEVLDGLHRVHEGGVVGGLPLRRAVHEVERPRARQRHLGVLVRDGVVVRIDVRRGGRGGGRLLRRDGRGDHLHRRRHRVLGHVRRGVLLELRRLRLLHQLRKQLRRRAVDLTRRGRTAAGSDGLAARRARLAARSRGLLPRCGRLLPRRCRLGSRANGLAERRAFPPGALGRTGRERAKVRNALLLRLGLGGGRGCGRSRRRRCDGRAHASRDEGSGAARKLRLVRCRRGGGGGGGLLRGRGRRSGRTGRHPLGRECRRVLAQRHRVATGCV